MALLLGVTAIASAGCGSSSHSAARARPVIAPELRTAVFHDRQYDVDGVVLANARQELIRRCMVGRGFKYSSESAVLPAPPGPTMPSPRLGYDLYARIAPIDKRTLAQVRRGLSNPNAGYFMSLSPARRVAFQLALEGRSSSNRTVRSAGLSITYGTTGCLARAVATLYGDLGAYYRGINELNAIAGAVNRRFQEDLRFKRAARAWRTCMRAKGLPFRSLDDVRLSLYDAYIRSRDPRLVLQRERVTAAADRSCGERSDIYHQQARLQQEALQSLTAEQARTVLVSASLRRQAVRRAKTIINAD